MSGNIYSDCNSKRIFESKSTKYTYLEGDQQQQELSDSGQFCPLMQILLKFSV